MRSKFKLLVLLCSVVASTALFAQSTTPSQSQGAKPSTVRPTPAASSAGSQASGAATGQTGAEGAGFAGMGIPGAVAAGLVAVGAAATNDNGSTPTPPKH